MTYQAEKLLSEVVHLPPVERAEFIEKVLASFDFSGRAEIDEAWAKEAEERIDAYEKGEIEAVPASAVFESIDRQRQFSS